MSSVATNPKPINLDSAEQVFYNLSVAQLLEHAIQNGEGRIASNGAITARTGKYTGRTPKDKYVVRDSLTENKVWWGSNNPMTPEVFHSLLNKAQAFTKGKKLYVVDTYGGADPNERIKARFIVQKAWHALFIKQLLIRPSEEELKSYQPDWTVLDVCEMLCDPAVDQTRSEAAIALNFTEKTVIIAGTQYAGEMKKTVFSVMNFILPLQGVMGMHCSANIGSRGDVALLFGLSGTGKTTLSADPERNLIGDDEHGWSDQGVFNIEGGCYAKCIRLSKEGEPAIWDAIRFGSVLENVILDEHNNPLYDDGSLTENTRCAYPVEYIHNAVIPSVGGHPKNVLFLTADAFGVLPPVSRLSQEQAIYHFLNGYTAKVAGTETGVVEPQATFSTCFAAPFLPLPPTVYADLLREKINRHQANVWLINTGWTGGPYGVGSRMQLHYSRAIVHAVLGGELDGVEFEKDPIFGLEVPKTCPGVPDAVLIPRNTWADKAAYDVQAKKLFDMFEENYKVYVQGGVPKAGSEG
ncbi:MAG TPA: phosphoenolpyruvate carboxykinase (ATP) [Fimbriimonadaceae bacterium]|jgi:phosphoenolpyruvate carboxykinase (ATP)